MMPARWCPSLNYSEHAAPPNFKIKTLVQEIFGRHETRELIPNGANIEVTEANKIDYISKMVEFRLTDGVKVRIKKVKGITDGRNS